jgi:hypothetical protein
MSLASSSGRVQGWKASAWEVLQELAGSGATFTADDLVARVGLPGSGRPNDSNAVGALFSAAARDGLIVRTGYRKAGRAASHARVLATWTGNPGSYP